VLGGVTRDTLRILHDQRPPQFLKDCKRSRTEMIPTIWPSSEIARCRIRCSAIFSLASWAELVISIDSSGLLMTARTNVSCVGHDSAIPLRTKSDSLTIPL